MQTKVDVTPRQRGCQTDKRGRWGEAVRGVLSMVLVAAASLVLAGCERWALDRQMEELCKKDGGVKVYETVTLPASEFSNTGQPLARYIPLAKTDAEYLGPDYRYVRKREVLSGQHANAEKGEGQLTRWHHSIYRLSDERLLGESVSYARAGGDGVTFGFQPSGKSCPAPSIDLAKSVFKRGE